MKPLSIPIHAVPAETRHDEEETPQYPEMPRGMATFSMPTLPEDADALAMTAARQILETFLDALNGWTFAPRSPGPRFDLNGVSPAVLVILNDMLGEGEVSARVEGMAGRDVRVQESVFTGVWRVREFDANGAQTAYWMEAGSLPTILLECAHLGAQPLLPEVALPEGAMNAPALFSEIRAQLTAVEANTTAEAPAHVINLTLLPLTPADHQALQDALPVGPVAIISKSFGSCRVTSTGTRHIWRVQHFNSKNTLILNTLMLVERPLPILAAAEDIEDTRERLAELIAWMAADEAVN